jgi:hypothetical protein
MLQAHDTLGNASEASSHALVGLQSRSGSITPGEGSILAPEGSRTGGHEAEDGSRQLHSPPTGQEHAEEATEEGPNSATADLPGAFIASSHGADLEQASEQQPTERNAKGAGNHPSRSIASEATHTRSDGENEGTAHRHGCLVARGIGSPSQHSGLAQPPTLGAAAPPAALLEEEAGSAMADTGAEPGQHWGQPSRQQPACSLLGSAQLPMAGTEAPVWGSLQGVGGEQACALDADSIGGTILKGIRRPDHQAPARHLQHVPSQQSSAPVLGDSLLLPGLSSSQAGSTPQAWPFQLTQESAGDAVAAPGKSTDQGGGAAAPVAAAVALELCVLTGPAAGRSFVAASHDGEVCAQGTGH